MKANLRVAGATNDLDALLPCCRDGPGFGVVGGFTDPDGYRIVLQDAAWPAD